MTAELVTNAGDRDLAARAADRISIAAASIRARRSQQLMPSKTYRTRDQARAVKASVTVLKKSRRIEPAARAPSASQRKATGRSPVLRKEPENHIWCFAK
jgi:hypothetical protein